MPPLPTQTGSRELAERLMPVVLLAVYTVLWRND